jgi:hypothetical protein
VGGAADGYESLQHGNQGYYFDPNDAAQYADAPQHGYDLAPQQGRYDDPYGGYSGDGSVDNTPLERENPLHVSHAFCLSYEVDGREVGAELMRRLQTRLGISALGRDMDNLIRIGWGPSVL